MKALMRRQVALSIVFMVLLTAAACSTPACAKAPVTASPQGTLAFRQNQVYKALGAIRDVAVSANDANPPLLERNNMRTVVQWEDAAIVTIHAAKSAAEWKPVVLTGLDETMKNLSESEQALLRPYVALAKTLIQEIQ